MQDRERIEKALKTIEAYRAFFASAKDPAVDEAVDKIEAALTEE